MSREPRLARRLDHIEPFYVMECAKAAREIGMSFPATFKMRATSVIEK